MISLKSIIFLIAIYNHFVTGQMEKSSLTFVIDDTYSMDDDIQQVKYSVNLIFDTVKNSKDSPIEDFIIVTFNDKEYHTKFLTRTDDRALFISNLSSIDVHGGGNCPESSLSGIYKGLEESRNGSFIFVFTDDIPEDTHLFEKVQNLAIKKRTQVAFIVTEHLDCGTFNKPGYEYYSELARATNGAVFKMKKQNVGQVLNYVADKIENRKTEILSKTLPPGYGHDVTIPIDPAMSDATLTSVGTRPRIENVTAPDGSKANTTTLVSLEGVLSIKIPKPVPGNYSAKVGSASETNFLAAATTDINFKYGFYPVKPTSMADTVAMPIAGEKSLICVQIFSKAVFKPSKIIVFNDKDEITDTLSLNILDAKENTFITDQFQPPNWLFKIGIYGYHEESKENIIRMTNTFIEVQKNFENLVNKSPVVRIDLGFAVKVKYEDNLKIVCNVEAYPKPIIEWNDNDGNIFHTEVLTHELPYSYMGELIINKVTINKTYTCTASNTYGKVKNNVKVEVERTQYLDILEKPTDTNIEFKNSDKISCKVDSMPPATITWHGNGAVLSSDEFIDTSGDALTVKQMMPHLIGDYSCAVSNGLESLELKFKISITGTEPSTSIEGPSKVNVEYSNPLSLRCLVKGYPKPEIVWVRDKTSKEIKSAPFTVLPPYDFGEEIQMEKVTKNATYRCVASNENGETSSVVTVITIPINHFDIIQAPKSTTIKYRDEGEISCKVDAYPEATVEWKFNNAVIKNDDNYEISSDGSSLKIRDMQPLLVGYYTCRVENEDELKSFNFRLSIIGTVIPEIDKTQTEIEVDVGSMADIECRIVKGTPPIVYSWEFQADNDDKFEKLDSINSHVHIKSFTRLDEGAYRCIARGVEGSDSHVVYAIAKYIPTIENASQHVVSKEGDKTTLKCLVHGYPTPVVFWNLNGINVTSSPEYQIFRDNSLRFQASLANSGNFICTATNERGTASIETQVDFYTEVEVIPPEETSFKITVKDRIKLVCEATGYPEPTITWEFRSSEPSVKPKTITPVGKSSHELKLKIGNVDQDGLYICTASNKNSMKRLLFNVTVEEPAHIIPDGIGTLQAVIGDLVRIPCRAEGKPKPVIKWTKGGLCIPTGHDYYSVSDDGSLLVEGITEGGTFYCSAENGEDGNINIDYASFKIDLLDYPTPTKEKATHTLRLGEPAVVQCPIPHTLVDVLRWFKDKHQIGTGELKFDKVTSSDAGEYICRVSHQVTTKSESKSVQITIIR